MTKSVRVENADTSSFQVRVVYQSKNDAGEWVDEINSPPTVLQFPTALATFGIHSHRRIVVEEVI